MSDEEIVFSGDSPTFEELAVKNGQQTWRESDLMGALGYASQASFRNAITRAMQACLALGIPTNADFLMDGESYRFTRFGCYLIAMNGDPKKRQVAVAQAYFAKLADTFQTHVEHASGIDRVLVRDEMAVGMKALSSTAKQHGVERYEFFLNEGYRGMYNMPISKLKSFKGLGQRDQLLDRMGRDELAANLFRITQTESKIQKDGIRGQRPLEATAHEVGKTVRDTMIRISGVQPEDIPVEEPIKDVKKKLKGANKAFQKIDGGGRKNRPRKSRKDSN